MPAGRNQVAYDEIDYEAITLIADGVTIVFDATKPGGSTAVGLAVMLSANDTVALTQDGSHVVGKLITVESDGKCAVQYDGMAKLPGGLAATLTFGAGIVGATGAAAARGYIRAAASAAAAELLVMKGNIVNNADATAVVVDLG